jgi:hypothetical protein
MRDHFRGSEYLQSETIARKRKNIGKTGITSEVRRMSFPRERPRERETGAPAGAAKSGCPLSRA